MQEIVPQCVIYKAIPSLPPTITILDAPKQLPKHARDAEIIVRARGSLADPPHPEVSYSESRSSRYVEFGRRNEYVPGVQVTVLGLALLKFIEKSKHRSQKIFHEGHIDIRRFLFHVFIEIHAVHVVEHENHVLPLAARIDVRENVQTPNHRRMFQLIGISRFQKIGVPVPFLLREIGGGNDLEREIVVGHRVEGAKQMSVGT